MKTLVKYINEKKMYYPADAKKLALFIERRYKKNPKVLDLTDVNISNLNELMIYDKRDDDWYSIFSYNIALRDTEVINITGWNTSKIKSFYKLFESCKSLKKIIGIEDLDTSNVTDFRSMFKDCKSLNDISFIDKFDMRKAKEMGFMFYGCSSLTNVDVSNWKLSNELTDINTLFGACSHLKTIKGLNSINVENVKFVFQLFFRCEELESIDISSWKLKKCENANNMFEYCYNLKRIIGEDVLKELYDKKIEGYNNMFTDCNVIPSWYKHWNNQ